MAQWQGIFLPVKETQETWVWSLGWEDPMQEEMATHSSVLVWKTAWIDEPGGLQSVGSRRVRQNWERTRARAHTHTHTHTHTHSLCVFNLSLVPNCGTCFAPVTGCVELDSWALHMVQLRLLIWRSRSAASGKCVRPRNPRPSWEEL